MVKDHSDSERGKPLPPDGILFSIDNKGSFYMHHPTDRITHTTTFVYTSRGALAGMRTLGFNALLKQNTDIIIIIINFFFFFFLKYS